MTARVIMKVLVMSLTILLMLMVMVSSQETEDGWEGGCEGVCQGEEGDRCERCRAGLATHLSILRQKMGSIPPPRIIPGR